jgi:hypothetical protein
MSPRIKALIRRRAAFRCEYCHFPERLAELSLQMDHVVARKHGGRGLPENLALACYRCNTHKGPNLSGLDPHTSQLCRLFNPRLDVWRDHFRWAGARLEGRTPEGRTTVAVLCINRPDALALRRALHDEGMDFR